MPNKIPQTQTDLEGHLTEQLQFLKSSADSFDMGTTGEAKRLATTLRVLLHDTPNSHSLLGQLRWKDKLLFCDTAAPLPSENIFPYLGLTAIWQSKSETKYIPLLDNTPHKPSHQGFEKWWNAVIFRDAKQRNLTRKDLVLYVANQDGGAHVDPELNELYAKLSRQNSLNWYITYEGDRIPPKEPERAAIRQIAHEMLKTLVPDYTKSVPLPPGGIIISSSMLMPGSLPTQPLTQLSAPKQGRNDPCWCGSGKKYKHCHGKFGL